MIGGGLGTVAANPSQEYNAALTFLNGGEAIGSPVYQMNLAAAQKQPGFDQAAFDRYWNALTVSGTGYNVGVADSPQLPAFIKYTGSSASNVVFALRQAGQPIPAAYAAAARGGVLGAGGTGGTFISDPGGYVAANAPPPPPPPAPTVQTGGTNIYVDPSTGAVWVWDGAKWINTGPGAGPVVVNPSPPSQPTNTGTSAASPDSTVSTANGSVLTTDIIPGITNTELFVGAGGLLVLVLLWQSGKKR